MMSLILFDFGSGVIRRIVFSSELGGDFKALDVENIKHAFLAIFTQITLWISRLNNYAMDYGQNRPRRFLALKQQKICIRI